MAYNSAYLTYQRALGGPIGGSEWLYDTADATATVDSSGYISDAQDRGMKKGDIVMVRIWSALPTATSDLLTPTATAPTHTTTSIHVVDGITAGGAADLTDGVVVGSGTNTD